MDFLNVFFFQKWGEVEKRDLILRPVEIEFKKRKLIPLIAPS